MWYASLMPTNLPEDDLNAAEAAVEFARTVRKVHARQSERDDPQRQQDILLALERLKRAMRPIRAAIGRFPYGPQTNTAESNRESIRAASEAIQRERRKLWKMR